MVSVSGDISLCIDCFYATDNSFKCDRCGYHETELGGLYHISLSNLCDECSEEYIIADCEDNIKKVEREIALHRIQIDSLKDKANSIDRLNEWLDKNDFFGLKLEVLKREAEEMERKLEALEALKREADEHLRNRGSPKLSNDDEKKLAYNERICELMKHKTKESLLDRALPKLSNAHVDVSKPPPTIDDPNTWMTFTLP